MQSRRRQPLGELPLHLFLEPQDDTKFAKPESPMVKRSSTLSPSIIISPPKRRMMLAEGLSPAKKLFFDSKDTESTLMHAMLGATYKAQAGSAYQPRKSEINSPSSSSSSSRPSSSRTSSSTSTAASSAYSMCSSPTTYAPSTPVAPSRTQHALAPSPEIEDKIMATPTSRKVGQTPGSLKRHRDTTPSSSPRASTKRRIITRGVSPLVVDFDEDKENALPSNKKSRDPDTKIKDILRTPRTRSAVAYDLKIKKAILEAEVNDEDEDMEL